QDVSDDDTTDAGLTDPDDPGEPAWVVRRTAVAELQSARLGEDIDITTFCSGLGRRWAERHLQVVGSGGARYEVSTLWICIDAATGRPRELTERFRTLYGPAAGGRQVTARLTHPRPAPAADRFPWPLRAVDLDVYGHVNNAAYWAVVEEWLDRHPLEEPFTASLEYAAGLDRGADVEVAWVPVAGGGVQLWWLAPDGTVPASARLVPLPGGVATEPAASGARNTV
ncbi:MAG: thioesterase, partial [Acidimicrobiia bacterium]|nr:thioesterase [Acidimicrobiia bacterium]